MQGGRRCVFGVAVAIAATTVLVDLPARSAAAEVAASTRIVHYDIPPQPLATALRRLADLSDWQVVFTPDVVAGLQSQGVRGDHTALEALDILMKGSGLTYKFDGKDTIVVRKPDAAPPATANSADPAATIEEIVVTAERRQQSALAVPISLTAFSRKDLEANHITDVEDYFAKSPNVYITGSPDRAGLVSGSSLQLAIRGISDIGGVSDSFGVYVDDFNINNVTVNPYLVDVDRIEVLKGPQSTFFGRNAEAGVISITTRKPIDQFEAEGTVDYSRFDTTDFKGMINVPIVPGLLLARFAGEVSRSDGALKNTNPVGGDNGYNSQYGRLSIRALPTDRLTIDLSASYSREHEDDYGLVNTGIVSSFVQGLCLPPVMCPSDGPWFPQNRTDYNHDNPLVVKTSYWIVDSTASWRADDFTVTNILGYSTLRFHRAGELDFSSWDFLREGYDERTQTSLSEELRVQSEGTGPLSWIFGGVFAHDNRFKHEDIAFGAQNGFVVPAGSTIENSNPTSHIKTYALFGELNYKVLPSLTLTVGGRYSHNDLSQHYHDYDDFGDPVVDNGGERTYHDFSPRFTASYAWNADISSYATVSKGWKAGGFQLN